MAQQTRYLKVAHYTAHNMLQNYARISHVNFKKSMRRTHHIET